MIWREKQRLPDLLQLSVAGFRALSGALFLASIASLFLPFFYCPGSHYPCSYYFPCSYYLRPSTTLTTPTSSPPFLQPVEATGRHSWIPKLDS